MKRFGLIGYPIKGSLSPALFRAGYHGKYTYDLIEAPDFSAAYRKFLENYDGVNVTAPFKEEAFRMAGTADPVCVKTGATNLMVKGQHGIYAFNSDYTGIQRSLAEALVPDMAAAGTEEIRKRTAEIYGREPEALVIGCGGAGKAAAVAAADLGMRTTLMNRTESKAENFAAALPGYRFRTQPIDSFGEAFWRSDIIIYTLPGSIPGIRELLSSAGTLSRDTPKLILEANYKTPSFSKDIIMGIASMCPETRYIGGLRWLLHQAAGGYELFTGEKPDFLAMEQVLSPEIQ